MKNEDILAEMRAHQVATIALIDKLAGPLPDPRKWRIGGDLSAPLNEAGVEEIRRRFIAGETNKMIAEAMWISAEGIRQRRIMWRKAVKSRPTRTARFFRRDPESMMARGEIPFPSSK